MIGGTNMTTDEILRDIIAHAPELELIRRAGRYLNTNLTPERLWRLYKMALLAPEHYAPETVEAMEMHCKQMAMQQDYNRTTTIRFRCTVNERNMIALCAAREGKTISDFIRSRLELRELK